MKLNLERKKKRLAEKKRKRHMASDITWSGITSTQTMLNLRPHLCENKTRVGSVIIVIIFELLSLVVVLLLVVAFYAELAVDVIIGSLLWYPRSWLVLFHWGVFTTLCWAVQCAVCIVASETGNFQFSGALHDLKRFPRSLSWKFGRCFVDWETHIQTVNGSHEHLMKDVWSASDWPQVASE